jgi:deoxyribodipyrimidine photo-lyase
MATKKIQEVRVRRLNEKEIAEGEYVLYWMQEAQRAQYNHALEHAVQRANELGQRLLVVFGLTDGYPEANLRHYAFLLEGLQDVKEELKQRNIKFIVRRGSPDEVALDAGKNASLIVCDMSYLRLQKKWREKVAEGADCLVVQVETEVVVPVELASNKREHAARTLRPRIQEHLDEFLVGLEPTAVEKQSLNMKDDGLDLSNVGEILDAMKLDRSVAPMRPPLQGWDERG